MIAIKKYSNPTKDTWRGWVWNQIAKRLPKNSTVVYLCGDYPERDKYFAEKHSLKGIGVDVNPIAVEKSRKNGAVAVHDDVASQIYAMQPDGAILDMLGGFTNNSFSVFEAAKVTCKAFCWNGMRGRDHAISRVYSELALQDFTVLDFGTKLKRPIESSCGLHRGKLMWAFSSMDAAIDSSLHLTGKYGECDEYSVQAMLHASSELSRPAFYTYRSKDGGSYFDSVAAFGISENAVYKNSITAELKGLVDRERESRRKSQSQLTRRKSAAAKAVSTKKRRKRRKV